MAILSVTHATDSIIIATYNLPTNSDPTMDPTDSKVERSSTSVSANDSERVGNSSTLESDEGGIALHAAEDGIPTTRATTKRKTN